MSNLQCGYITSKDRQRHLFKWILALQAVLICSLLLFLGNWQLQRAAEKEQLLLQFTQGGIKQNSSATPILLFDKIELSGQLLTDHYFFLDNRTWQGQVGYEVIAALKTSDANIQLISLGWLAAPIDRNLLPPLTLPSAVLNVTAYADRPSKALLLGDDTWTQSWPKRIQQLDFKKIASALNTPVAEWLYRPVSQVIPALTLTWKPVVLPPQRHTGYAIQWYGLAITWLICSIILARKMFINKEIRV